MIEYGNTVTEIQVLAVPLQRMKYALDGLGKFFSDFTLPNNDHGPTNFSNLALVQHVTVFVVLQFGSPVIDVLSRRSFGAYRAAMPITALNKDGHSPPWIGYVRFSRK